MRKSVNLHFFESVDLSSANIADNNGRVSQFQSSHVPQLTTSRGRGLGILTSFSRTFQPDSAEACNGVEVKVKSKLLKRDFTFPSHSKRRGLISFCSGSSQIGLPLLSYLGLIHIYSKYSSIQIFE